MSDCTSLTCYSTACYCANDIVLIHCICYSKWLTNDELECLKTEVIVNVSAVDCDLTCTLVNTNTGNSCLLYTSDAADEL